MLRLDARNLSALSVWIAAQSEPRPSRPEAIRRILAQALEHLSGEAMPAVVEELEPPGAEALYHATRLSGESPVDEWQGHAVDDESALQRSAQHLKLKLDEETSGHAAEDLVTLSRPDGEIVTMARAGEMVERLRGWKASPRADRAGGGDNK